LNVIIRQHQREDLIRLLDAMTVIKSLDHGAEKRRKAGEEVQVLQDRGRGQENEAEKLAAENAIIVAQIQMMEVVSLLKGVAEDLDQDRRRQAKNRKRNVIKS
jgi:hypothetical protein